MISIAAPNGRIVFEASSEAEACDFVRLNPTCEIIAG